MNVVGIVNENNKELNVFTTYVLSLFEDVDTELININDESYDLRHTELIILSFSTIEEFNDLFDHKKTFQQKPLLLIQIVKNNVTTDFDFPKNEAIQNGLTVWGTYSIADIKNNFNDSEGIIEIKERLTLIRLINDIIYNKMKRNLQNSSCGIERENREYGDESDY